MKDNLIIAQTLYDWTVSSKTSFIEGNDKLNSKLEALGLKFPNPDLALFETIYCELDVANRNGVTLPKEVAEKGLDTLIGKQINFEHYGQGFICGYIVDARIENNFIIVDGMLFKSIWRDEFDKVKAYFEQKQLFVSFELWNTEDGASIVTSNEDGSKTINKLIAHGCGLLMDHKPACPKATVTQLLASDQIIGEIEKIMKPIFQKDDRLVYAELCIKEECKNCATCQYERRTTIMEEAKKLCATCEQPLTDEEVTYCAKCKSIKAEEDAKVALEAEAKIKADEEAKLKAESEAKAKAEEEEKAKIEAEAKVKAEEEAKIKADEEARIKAEEELKVKAVEKVKELETEIEKIKAEMIVKDTEITTMKEELGKKDQEIADLTIVKAEAEAKKIKAPEMTVGSVETTDNSFALEQRKKIDAKLADWHKNRAKTAK